MPQSGDTLDSELLDTLLPNEEVLGVYRPKLILFTHRTLGVAVLTAFLMGTYPLGLSLIMILFASLGSALAYAFCFGEFDEWLERRRDVWILTDQRVLFQNSDDSAEFYAFEYSDIRKAKGWLWWAVRIVGKNGQVSVMRYVGPVRQIRNTIRDRLENIEASDA